METGQDEEALRVGRNAPQAGPPRPLPGQLLQAGARPEVHQGRRQASLDPRRRLRAQGRPRVHRRARNRRGRGAHPDGDAVDAPRRRSGASRAAEVEVTRRWACF